jgi:hypothetical protein
MIYFGYRKEKNLFLFSYRRMEVNRVRRPGIGIPSTFQSRSRKVSESRSWRSIPSNPDPEILIPLPKSRRRDSSDPVEIFFKIFIFCFSLLFESLFRADALEPGDYHRSSYRARVVCYLLRLELVKCALCNISYLWVN